MSTGSETSSLGSTKGLQSVKRAPLSQAWYLLRRWPLIPLFIMIILVFTGLFAHVIAPEDPTVQSLKFRNFEPTWGRAMPEYNIVPSAEDFDLETTVGYQPLIEQKNLHFRKLNIF